MKNLLLQTLTNVIFQPITILNFLKKNCGLLSYTKPLDDKVGRSSREAVQGVKLVGTGTEYIKATELANDSLTYVDATTDTEVTDNFDSNGEFILPTNGIKSLTTGIYKLNLNLDENFASAFIPSDDSDIIKCQGYLMSPSNIVEDIDVISFADEYGFTKAIPQTYYYDDTFTDEIPVNTIIPANEIGLLAAYYTEENWILYSGSWNDSGVWNDKAEWRDS